MIAFDLATLLAVGALAIAIKCIQEAINRYRRPPGPWYIPFFGSLSLLKRHQVSLRTTFADLRERYGDIFALSVGNQNVVVVNGFENIEEALVNKEYCFNGRPNILWTELTGGKGIFSSEGELWSEQRKAVLRLLKSLDFDKTQRCQDIIKDEAQALCTRLLAAPQHGTSGAGIDPQCYIDAAFCNVSSVVVLGKRYDADDGFFRAVSGMLDDIFLYAGLQNLVNYFPLLRYLPGDPYRGNALATHASVVVSYLKSIVDEHKTHLHENGYFNPRDFIDAYLIKSQEESSNPKSFFTDSQLIAVLTDLFAMSIEAGSTTLRWALLLLAEHQQIQNRLQREIDLEIGCDRSPTVADRARMPYTKAFILELHRYCSVVALNLPHSAMKDVVFKGYTIRKGTLVIPNLSSIHFDGKTFPDPEKFNPDRFMESDASGTINLAHHVVPFSMGPRLCLGESLAQSEVFLFLASLLQKLSINSTSAVGAREVQRRCGLIDSPTKFLVCVKPRFA